MNTLAVIAEYNPFHNGHFYQLYESKRNLNISHTIVIMSGNFIQRGEPSIINKWARAKMALLNGVDLVLELPTAYAMSSAENFSFGAIKILDSLKIVDYLSFGSECGDLEILKKISDILITEPLIYKNKLKSELDKGLSFANSRELAIEEYLSKNEIKINSFKHILNNSNNILAVEYLKSLNKLNSKIKPYTLRRISNSYNQKNLTGEISSATSIRALLYSPKIIQALSEIEFTLPKSSFEILRDELINGRGPIHLSDFNQIIISKLRLMKKSEILTLPYINEGIHNLILSTLKHNHTVNKIIDGICSKRYARTRISRTLTHTLTSLKDSDLQDFNSHGGPSYVKILGFNSKGQEILKRISKNANIKLLSKVTSIYELDEISQRIFEIDNISTDQYVLAYSNDNFKNVGQEFTQNIIKVN